MSRGLSNCNPGNIRRSKVSYEGERHPSRDPDFKEFLDLDWGYRAIFMLLHTYRIRHHLKSIAEMITRWAPPTENHTQIYIRRVSSLTGIPADAPLDTRSPATMIPIAAAISEVENGMKANMASVRRGFNLFVG